MPSKVPADHGSREWLSDYPELCEQLDFELSDVNPGDIRYGSGLRLWWRCEKGPDHSWEQRVCNRTRGSGCPFCSGVRVSITNCLATRFPEVAAQWHPTRNGELTPREVVGGATHVAWWSCPAGPDHEWEAPVSKRTLDASGCPFCAGFRVSLTNSLAARYPELALEWHRVRNRALKPWQVVAGSTRVVWWKCPEGSDHVWQASLHDRTACGNGCPFCAGVDSSRTNSVAALAPALVDEWDHERNHGVEPHDVVAASKRRVWWRCPEASDHRWEASVASRASRGAGCPFCANRALAKSNSLAKVSPKIAALWHPTRNLPLAPADIVAGGRDAYWWRCPDHPHHVWRATIGKRLLAVHRCPFCAGVNMPT
jgi:hypothetical protein